MIDQLILSINPNGSLFNLTMIFDLANTSLFYTLSYVWRNPILFFFILKPFLNFEFNEVKEFFVQPNLFRFHLEIPRWNK